MINAVVEFAGIVSIILFPNVKSPLRVVNPFIVVAFKVVEEETISGCPIVTLLDALFNVMNVFDPLINDNCVDGIVTVDPVKTTDVPRVDTPETPKVVIDAVLAVSVEVVEIAPAPEIPPVFVVPPTRVIEEYDPPVRVPVRVPPLVIKRG